MRRIVEKCLGKYNLKLEDINLSINCKQRGNGHPDNISKHQTVFTPIAGDPNRHYHQKQHHTGNFSSPLLCSKRKRCNNIVHENPKKSASETESEDKSVNSQPHQSQQGLPQQPQSNTDLTLNQKEKENMFEEVNQLTADIISSPRMSPPRFQKNESNLSMNTLQENELMLNNNGGSNGFNGLNNHNCKFNNSSENFFILDNLKRNNSSDDSPNVSSQK